MNNPPTVTDYIVIIILFTLGAIMLWILIWRLFLRKRTLGEGYGRPSKEDEAYNALSQAKTLVRMLKKRGNNTAAAERVLTEAERELQRGHYTTVISLSSSAKTLARNQGQVSGSLEIDSVNREIPVFEEPRRELRPATRSRSGRPVKQPSRAVLLAEETEDIETRVIAKPQEGDAVRAFSAPPKSYYAREEKGPLKDKTDELLKGTTNAPVEEALPEESDSFSFRKKMPEFYMESKFKIELAGQAIADSKLAGKDTAEAEKALNEAVKLFKAESFPQALSAAIRAEKLAAGKSLGTTIREAPKAPPGTPTTIVDRSAQDDGAGSKVVTDVKSVKIPLSQKSMETTMTKPMVSIEDNPELTCVKCEKPVSGDDNFCRKCGTPVEKPLNCPKCDRDLEKEDIFCRKCGEKVDHITQK